MMTGSCLVARTVVARRALLAGAAVATGLSGIEATAQFDVDIAYAEPVDLPGFTVVMFTIDSAFEISAVEGIFNGPMNHVNPVGESTIFNNSNAFFNFIGADVSQDSQFLLNSGSFQGSDMLIATPSLSETDSQLSAAFTLIGFNTFGEILPLAQVVIPNDGPGLDWSIAIVDNNDTGSTLYEESGFVIIPEPASAMLALVGGTVLLGRRRRR